MVERSLSMREKKIEAFPTAVWEYKELVEVMQHEIRRTRQNNCWIGKRKPRKWWNKEIKQAIEERKEASRVHREAKKLGLQEEEVLLRWNTYREKKRVLSELVQEKIKCASERWVHNIHKRDKGAPKRFWNHIKALGAPTRNSQTAIRDEDGNIYEGDDALRYITDVIRDNFGTRKSVVQTTDPATAERPERSKFSIESFYWKKAAENVPNNTAAGPDEIPIQLIKNLGPKSKALLTNAIEQVIRTKNIPVGWRESKMNLIYKGKGDKDKTSSYRPVTVTSVIYRMAMQAIKLELSKWVEENGVLGELQNGFRPGRRLEDNMFVLTQCIEISVAQKRPLWIAFLDIKGAYDNVDRELLWDILQYEGIDDDFVELLREIYRDNQVQVAWEGRKGNEMVGIHQGLKQGCPLSPLLFTLYVKGIERRLENSELGFDLSYMRNGQMVQQKVPGLMYADDIVLLADNKKDLQILANICGNAATNLGLKFSTEKSGIMIFNEHTSNFVVSIQQQVIPIVKQYKYLGVHINEGKNYSSNHQDNLKIKGKRNAAIMKHRALWGHNKYEVVRGIWKGVMVPALTFANAIICLKSDILAGLEVNQRSVGRLALGAHGNTTNEAVHGDMGWASFEVREAQSKISFEERLRNMDENKWAAKVHKYLYMKSVDTEWRKRSRKLATKYRIIETVNRQPGVIRKKVREIETVNWMQRMETKRTMEIYKNEKKEIRRENLYDNTKGSALLFEARAGCLRTKTYRNKYSELDETCVCCSKDPETTQHILMECDGIHPARTVGNVQLPEALGFKVEGNINRSAVEISKRRLEYWWKKSREKMDTT